jgi:DNA-binding NarL/FixJ family response regulator
MAAGASAYTSRTAMPAAILATVVQALASPQAFTADDLMAAQRRRSRTRHTHLSAREAEVLNLLANGLTIPEVAAQLFIAESTAKSHVDRIYVKLGVNTRSAAIMAGLSQGLITAKPQGPH